MPTIGVYLIFAAVFVRAAVVLAGEPEFPLIAALLAGYGLVLFAETRFVSRKSSQILLSSKSQIAYLFLQFILVISVLVITTYEDFLALLLIPLSLEAVSFFGRRDGYRIIAVFSLAMTITFLFSDEGPLFGLAMGMLYSGICFLFGGYAHQVQKAKAAHDQNELTYHELQTAHHQLQAYADQMASLTMEQERNRLARDLHDSVTQTIFSMNLTAQSARLLLQKEPTRVASQLVRLEELAASAQQEIQSLVSQLRPHSIIEEGLGNALYRLAIEQKVRNGLQVSLEIQGEKTYSEQVTTSLYSIAHEALINVSKHSGVREAILRLNLDKDNSWLEIEDCGLGFNPQAALDQRGHFGLAGMFERAREIGWNLSITSRPNQGTRIRVTETRFGDTLSKELE